MNAEAVMRTATILFLFTFIFIALSITIYGQSENPSAPQFMEQPITNSTTNSQNFYVVVTSHYPGQAQELTLPLNSSGYMMYPDWNFLFFSDEGNTSYQIYLNGGKVSSGSFIFKSEYSMNVTTNFANVSIILVGQTNTTVFNFYNIPILHTTLGNYFSRQTVELPIYTLTQGIEIGVKAVISSALVGLASYSIVSRTYVAKKRMEVVKY